MRWPTVPDPDGLSDEQVLMCPDIMSTGFSGAERGEVSIGDTVVVFALGPIGLCAVAGARLKGASMIIGVDGVAERMNVARGLGATHIVDFKKGNVVEQIMALTDGRGVDVAIEALGTQGTFESALRVLRPGGRVSSLGVYSSDLHIPYDAFSAGLGDYSIVSTLCPGGKERMRRLMAVVASGGVDLSPLVTHRFKLDDIEAAYELFAHQRDGVHEGRDYSLKAPGAPAEAKDADHHHAQQQAPLRWTVHMDAWFVHFDQPGAAEASCTACGRVWTRLIPGQASPRPGHQTRGVCTTGFDSQRQVWMTHTLGLAGAAAALGIGMLIGLERERRKGQGEDCALCRFSHLIRSPRCSAT
jgi:hypothetical protein